MKQAQFWVLGLVMGLAGLAGAAAMHGVKVFAAARSGVVADSRAANLPIAPAFVDLVSFEDDVLSYSSTGHDLEKAPGIRDVILAEQPELIAAVRAAAMEDKRGRDARGERFERWDHYVTFRVTARAGRLASVLRIETTDRGLPQPQTRYASAIVDSGTARTLMLEDLLETSGQGAETIERALCEELRKAKAARGYAEHRLGEPLMCDATAPLGGLTGTALVLVPSDLTGAFGGIAVHFAPGETGPVREGSYVVTLPQALFRDALAPEFRDLFEGSPAGLRVDARLAQMAG